MPESLRTRLWRWTFNLWPCYRGTGGRVTAIAADWREVRVCLPLNWRTRNYVGTTFGGSMGGAVDPFFMIMLIKLLGPGCTVWDKAAPSASASPAAARFTPSSGSRNRRPSKSAGCSKSRESRTGSTG